PLERRRGGREHVSLAVVEPGLDRLEIPVAEVVERQVIQLADEMSEAERLEVRFVCALRRREAREDPALLERRRALRDLGHARLEQQPARVPELVRELPPFLDRS